MSLVFSFTENNFPDIQNTCLVYFGRKIFSVNAKNMNPLAYERCWNYLSRDIKITILWYCFVQKVYRLLKCLFVFFWILNNCFVQSFGKFYSCHACILLWLIVPWWLQFFVAIDCPECDSCTCARCVNPNYCQGKLSHHKSPIFLRM